MKARADYDSPWKEAIRLYFHDFLVFFFPEIHADVDWERGYEQLESELQAITRDAKQRRRHVDALVRVYRRNGSSQLVLIHVEVQSREDPRFTARMLLYHTRIADRFGESVCSLAILADGKNGWRPSEHKNSLWGCELKMSFPMKKLLDYPAWASETKNPFSWLTAAQLQAQGTRGRPEKRSEIKFRLCRGLYECGLTRPQLMGLFRLLDWVLALPEPLEYTFKQDLARFERENNMPYITSFERIGRKEGRKEGLEEERERSCQTLRDAILKRHQQRWGELDAASRTRLQELADHPRLVDLLAELMAAQSSGEWTRTF